jgi:hypothetical protein
MERYEETIKEGNPQRTLRSRFNRFPNLEEKVIGGNIDLDLLFLFLKNMQESWEEWRREGKLSRSTMEERESAQFIAGSRRKKEYIYPLQN